MTQYAQTRPWILLQEGGENTYASTAMPQKRNPGLMNNTRTSASSAIGLAQGSIFRAHNVTPGMSDPKSVADNTAVVNATIKALDRMNKVLKALVVNPERALEELNSDWTSSQEVADRLMREYKLPFRVGHHVASEMVTYARQNNLTPLQFPYDQMQRIYAEVVAKEYPQGSSVLPMSEEEFRATIDPKTIILNRQTAGGPQPKEMEKMLKSAKQALDDNAEWAKDQRERIGKAEAKLEKAFQKILK
jgi:argininosuccinate lyase